MKFIRAEFENFRLLRDLKLDFSTDSIKKLTVIRAENESGKTTILNALQWALYGEDALPGKGRGYRLSPIDWHTSENTRVPISVQVDFEITNYRETRRGDTLETTEQYRIIRATSEILNGIEYNRSEATVKLFELTDQGGMPISSPEAFVHDKLPSELREVFFTDGDRALSFIETTASAKTKRERVEKAIRSLLGLEVIENALKHVKRIVSELNKEVKKIREDEELIQITEKLEHLDTEILDIEKKLDDANDQFAEFDLKCVDIDKDIKAALTKGNREELKQNLEETKAQLQEIDNQRTEARKKHSRLFESLTLYRDLLAPVLKKSFEKLNQLHAQGKLPSTAVPILEERLTGNICICGESLDPEEAKGQARREHIQHLIEESRKQDVFQKSLTDLYYAALALRVPEVTNADHWRAEYTEIIDRREELDLQREDLGKNLRALEVRIDGIPDIDIHGLRTTEREYIAQRDRFNADRAKYEIQLEDRKKAQRSLASTRKNLLTQQRRGERVLTRIEVTSDIEQVLQNSYDRITNEELDKVSKLMNQLFLEMIGSDPEQEAIIQKAEISDNFDILVYGPNDRPLDPDRDLNGASRRALTLAFILGLTKVSEVEAPNVIDTPLGMMSGYVKKAVLKTAIQESSQLVLFLTRSEIADCQDILDTKAGRVITLTNTAHYPRILINNPQVAELKVLRCECHHHQDCQMCKRRIDVEPEIDSTD